MNAAKSSGFKVLAQSCGHCAADGGQPLTPSRQETAGVEGAGWKERPFGEPQSAEEPFDIELGRARERGRGRHASHAKVEGDIVAEELTISGQVKGTIHANRVKLNSTAVVEGDIFHRSLSIEENARFEGLSKREDKAVDVPRPPLRRSATQDDLQTGVTAIQGNGKSNGARDKDAYADAGAS